MILVYHLLITALALACGVGLMKLYLKYLATSRADLMICLILCLGISMFVAILFWSPASV